MFNVVKKVKKKVILVFFSYFTWDYLLKQEAVVLKPPKWKFVTIIAKNTKFKECYCQIFARFGSKIAKKLIIFNIFTLVSQS